MPCGAVLRNVCIHIFSLFFLTSVVRSGWPAIGTVNISGPRAALQRRRRKCGSITGWVGYRFLCTTSATLWLPAKPLNSLRLSDAYICVGNLTIIWSAPSHYLNQCWYIVNWTPRNKLQLNVNRNSYTFIQENPFENVVWKMAAILSRPQCVKSALVQERVALWSRDACQL